MKKRYKLILFLSALVALVSCSTEDEPARNDFYGPVPIVINAGISGSTPQTRVVRNEPYVQDGWSYTDFTEGDEMGFFSSSGKYTDGNFGEAPFDNQKLIYTGGTGGDNFRDPDNTQFSPSHMNGNDIFMYYPYSEDITGELGVTLRVQPEGEENPDSVRCMDFLSTDYLDIMGEVTSSKPALYGEFKHTFAELIIMRGKGFDKPGNNDWTIRAVLNTPVTGIRTVVTEDPWKCTPELVWDSLKTERLEASTWHAWLGGNFSKTTEDEIGQNAWYVIVPTIGCDANLGEKRSGPRTMVQYIELYDNDGNLQRVNSLRLSNGNTKYVDGGWRYPMEITLEELVPTANPCVILPWNGDIDLTDERKRGISTTTDFEHWIVDYNNYLLDEDNQAYREKLLQYGDLYIDQDKQPYWHFYVLNNLDLSTLTGSKDFIIPQLKDILDGKSTDYVNGKFLNHTITGLSMTLIGELSGSHAQLENFNFEEPDVKFEDNTSAAGIIAGTIDNGGTVENCNIYDGSLYNPNGPGGMVVGTIGEGTIKNCHLEGFLSSLSTYNKIAGVANTASSIFQGNNAVNVIIISSVEDD